MSGVDIDGSSIRKGAVDAVLAHVNQSTLASSGARPASDTLRDCRRSPTRSPSLARHAAGQSSVTGACSASSTSRTSSGRHSERFAELRKMGIRTVMITGDNPMTAGGGIAAEEAGVDDFLRPGDGPRTS